mmetsp:Transcript_22410/g.38694  ORF Transcript_22410/g.38694 Transcript_22410/m.38694 type:complete len:220 (-) Transcript_22410:63-722(-)|eukprot:CAMPEP_0184695180 /NCGR_PEP_ID=MMETSP0313-20130426/2897_1 /TAXON_ID=2792 /ORGANISM="Porphyridium aerugineum, Strain SAG 1380-2" /LENGTH=219 /DNA_ID=CAMNT_0027153593 /DNA_START=166 /DNA_END=825 /DNA_ORIENTATION=+
MNDQQVKQQIQQMVSFIRQEAEEKANEILVKAEEEFNIRKLSAVEAAREKIRADYEKRTKQIVINQKIAKSTEMNAARLKTLKAMDQQIQLVLQEALNTLATRVKKNPNEYKAFLDSVILQGLVTLGDTDVVLKVRLADAALVKSLVPDIQKKYKDLTKKDVKLSIDGASFLDEKSVGGVALFSCEGRIFIENTFESRLNIAFEQNLPAIRKMLFEGIV